MASPIVAAQPADDQRAARWRRLVGGLGAVAILLALATRTDVLALLAFAVAGVLLIGVALFLGEPRRLARFVAVNLVFLALLAWALSERGELVVEVEGNRVEARFGGVRLAGTADFAVADAVGIKIGAVNERPFVARWAYQPGSWIEGLGLWLSANVLAGVTDMSLVAPDGTPVAPTLPTIWQPLRAAEPPQSTTAVTGWVPRRDREGDVELVAAELNRQAVRAQVTLIRPGSDVVVTVRPRTGNPVAVRAAPDRRTFELAELIGDEDERPLVGGLFEYRRPATAWTQALIRELSRPWLLALAALGAARLLAVRLPASLLGDPEPLGRTQSVVMALSFGLAGLMLTGLVASFVLERVPHVQDSVTYLFQAEVLALGRLSVPAPSLPEFFQQEFILARDGRWFGKYSPGQPLVLALGALIGAPWLVSPVLAGAAVVLTYLTGRRLHGDGVAALAVVLLLFSPFFLLMSGDMMAHPAGLFWTALLVYQVVAIWQGGARWAWLLAGLAFGMLLITRQLTALGVGAAPLLVLAVVALREPRLLPARTVLFAVGVLPSLAFLAYFNAQLTGSAFVNPFELWWDFDRIGFGPDIGMHGGHDLANGLANTFANLSELLRHLYGWPAYATLALAFVPVVLVSRAMWDWVLLGSAAGLMLGYVFFWADGIMYGPRYYYESIGIISLLGARGCALLADLPARVRVGVESSGATRLLSARPAVLVLLVGLIAGNVLGYLPAIVGASRGYNGVSRARLDVVERAGLAHALVFVRQDWPDWQPYGSVFPANGPLLNGAVIYALDFGPVEDRRLMAAYPDRDAYLLDGLSLVEIRR